MRRILDMSNDDAKLFLLKNNIIVKKYNLIYNK